MPILTDADRQILPMTLRHNGGFHVFTRWYLDFDPLPYQYAWHQVSQQNTTIKGGIAVGKTVIATASCLADIVSIPYFKILNTSVTAKQAELAFDKFMGWYEGNKKLEHLIDDVKLRPWPVVKFKNFSEWEFRTAGTDARFIRGTEYDRIVFDECGLDWHGEIVKILRGRLRGTRPDGTLRMCRLDTISSPSDAPWFIERFKKGWKGSGMEALHQYISFKMRTYDNTRLTRDMISLMEAELTDELIEVELNAEDPDYGLSMFPKSHIHACTSQGLNDMAYMALNPEEGRAKQGWKIEEHPRHGITKFEAPWDPKAVYVQSGDPGTDDPPKRNAGCVLVFNVSKKPAQLAYFDWTFGHGSYMPFLNSYKYALQKYKPVLRTLDTTGPQKAMQELAFEQMDIPVDGLNFARDKEGCINALSLAVTNHELEWPLIKGLVRQMSLYSREAESSNKLAQDIVMTLAMIAFMIRFSPSETDENYEVPPRPNYFDRRRRTSRGRRR